MPTQTELEFCKKVDEIVKKHYGLGDGGDFCFNLLQTGVISIEDGETRAARVVAQHFLQP